MKENEGERKKRENREADANCLIILFFINVS